MTDPDMRIEISPAPVRLQAVEMIRQAIISGRFQPGQKLSDKTLCEMLGVSRPSVREALRQLETDGLIVNAPYKGPSVARLSLEDVRNIYQVRGALEALAARNFAQLAGDEEVAQLARSIERLGESYATGDVDRILETKRDFYAVLLGGSRNPVIVSSLRALNDRITLIRRVTLSSPIRLAASLKELHTILRAIEARDAQAAHEATMAHIDKALETAITLL